MSFRNKPYSNFSENIAIIFVLFITLISYSLFFKGFFQQDEWFAFGSLYKDRLQGLLQVLLSSFKLDVGHYTPLFKVAFTIYYRLFDLSYDFWFLQSIVWHMVNTYLVYMVASKIFEKKSSIKIIAVTLLFGISASTYQATTWVGANINTHGATAFGLLSMYYFFKYKGTSNFRKWSYSIIFLTVSLLFKEIAVGMFGVYAIFLYLESKKIFDKKLIAVGITGGAYFIFRGLMFLIPQSKTSSVATQTQSIHEILENMFTFPIKSFAQTIIPQQYFVKVGYFLAEKYPVSMRPDVGTTEFDIFTQNYVLESLSIIVFILFSYLVFQTFKKSKEKSGKLVLLFFYLFVVFNSFIYALSPERFGKISVLDSRNLYFTSIGVFILLVLVTNSLIKREKVKYLLISLFALVNIMALNTQIKILVEEGNVRREILHKIKDDYEKLPHKTVFYTQSDTAYYGLPESETILPFQSGFGHTLMVYYASSSNLNPKSFENSFLWEITDQGYKEIDGQGFGYFRNFDLLKEAYEEYNIPNDSVIAFSWNSELEILKDISKEVREQLK